MTKRLINQLIEEKESRAVPFTRNMKNLVIEHEYTCYMFTLVRIGAWSSLPAKGQVFNQCLYNFAGEFLAASSAVLYHLENKQKYHPKTKTSASSLLQGK